MRVCSLYKASVLTFAAMAGWGAFSADPAAAAGIAFTFDNMGGLNHTTSSQNASSTQISSYMTSVLGSAVTVYGAIGEQGAGSYVGDNHVVGPTEGTKVYPLTLADTNNLVNPTDTTKWDGAANNTTNPPTFTTNGAVNDGFIKNCTGIDPGLSGKTGCGATSPDIYIDFHGFKFTSFSFDFEIFPDGTCPAKDTGSPPTTTCGVNNANLPDLEIYGGTSADTTAHREAVHFGTFWGVTPGASTPVMTGITNVTYTTYTKSGVSGVTPTTEFAPQLLGRASYTVAAGTTITGLDFMDWPETIGIDNLYVGLPEPASIAMFALGLIGLAMIARRKRARGAPLVGSNKQG